MPEAIYTARPLTDEEKIFAEKNHNLMYRYIRIHELDLEDWYDILIIPYLQAVKKYFTYEHLQKYKFEQIFFRTLDSARSNYWRAMNRKMRCPSGGIYSYENLVCKRERDDLTGLECAENMAYLANGICNESAENEVVGTEMLKEALKTLDAEEQMIIKKKLYGYSDEEIYKSKGRTRVIYTPRERKMIYHKAEGRCQLCGCKITYDEMSLDHIVPLAMGGEDSLENLQATCEPCNSHKKALLPEAYFDKVNRTFVFQMNKKYSHNLLWKLSKLFIGRLEKQA